MTREEARLAVRNNAEVIDRNGIHGYAYSLMWFHFKGKEPYLIKAYKKRCTTYKKNGCYFVGGEK